MSTMKAVIAFLSKRNDLWQKLTKTNENHEQY
jgi:hypothetical protein